MLTRLLRSLSTPCGQQILRRNLPTNFHAQQFQRNFSAKIVQDDGKELNLLAQNDPDQFGSLSIRVSGTASLDDGDLMEEEYLQNPPTKSQKLRTKQYADIIKEHLRNKRMKEALDVLEVRMLKEDRVKPENYIFNLLIGACGRTGYSKKAFQLYNQMKQRDLKVTGGTYTALFNACATSPWPQDGLEKANRLRAIMIEKGYEPNASNYNAMIKAFGRCGDVELAFQMVDEMKAKGWQIHVDTFNFLLQACISDKELGFRHALIVWHKMRQHQLTPDIFSFNLMLRCVRDCGIGDVQMTEDVVRRIVDGVSESQVLELPAEASREKNLDQHVTFVEAADDCNVQMPTTPNLLSQTPHLGTLVSIGQITKPEDRLVLLGGSNGFLSEMDLTNVSPDIKTFTELLDVIPPTLAAEKVLLSALRKRGIKCDIDFFNILIKKRSMRFDYAHAKEVMRMIKTAKLEPNIVTYGVLALGCTTKEEAHELQQEMYEKGIRLNMQILGAMLRQGCAHKNFEYVLEILNIIKDQRLRPSEQLLVNVDKFVKHCRKKIHMPEHTAGFKKDYHIFLQKLDNWKDAMGLKDLPVQEAVKLVREHPWEQFKQPQAEGFEAEKNKKLKHKKKMERYIRRIKVDQLAGGESDKDQRVIDN